MLHNCNDLHQTAIHLKRLKITIEIFSNIVWINRAKYTFRLMQQYNLINVNRKQ